MNVLTGQEVVSNLCELLHSEFKIPYRVVLISDDVAYVGRIIISLLAFESFRNKIFFLREKNNLPSSLVYYQSVTFVCACLSVHNKLVDPKRS